MQRPVQFGGLKQGAKSLVVHCLDPGLKGEFSLLLAMDYLIRVLEDLVVV